MQWILVSVASDVSFDAQCSYNGSILIKLWFIAFFAMDDGHQLFEYYNFHFISHYFFH